MLMSAVFNHSKTSDQYIRMRHALSFKPTSYSIQPSNAWWRTIDLPEAPEPGGRGMRATRYPHVVTIFGPIAVPNTSCKSPHDSFPHGLSILSAP